MTTRHLLWVLLVLLCAPPAEAQETRLFARPAVEGVAIDWCLGWATDCGQPAADRFCRDHGFPRASGFQIAEDVGLTLVQATGQRCDDPGCDGFRFVECSPAAAAAAAPVRGVPVRGDPGVPPEELRHLELQAPPIGYGATHLEAYREVSATEVHAPGLPQRGSFGTQRLQLNWRADDLTVRLRWSSEIPAGAGGTWEISSTAFPLSGRASERPPGYLASGPIPPAPPGDWREFTVDLRAFAPRPFVRGEERGQPRRITTPLKIHPMLFVRARPVDGRGGFVGSPSNQIILAFAGQQGGKLVNPGLVPRFPAVRFVRHEPIRPYLFGFQCRGIFRKDFKWVTTMYPKGTPINLCQSSSSNALEDFVDGIGDAFGSLVEFAGAVVDFAAEVYSDAKSTAMGLVVQALASTTGCGDECQWALDMAMDAALTAAGMPPSVPNFDQLVSDIQDQGVEAVAGALVDAAASQGVPLPPEAARAAVDQLAAKTKAAAAGGGTGPGGWVGIDPAALYSPAVIVLELSNPDPSHATWPINLELDSNNPTPGGGLFSLEVRPVPALQPGTKLLLSFELDPVTRPDAWVDQLPTVADFPHCSYPPPNDEPALKKYDECYQQGWAAYHKKEDDAKASLASWTQTYAQGTRTFRVRMESLDRPGSKPIGILQCGAQNPNCQLVPFVP